MSRTDPRSDAQLVFRQLTEMGVKARLMEGERCVLATMRMQPAPIDGLEGAVLFDQVMFVTVGRDSIKCLRPRALFQLPLIRILDCRDTTSIEARIRLAWKRHIGELEETRAWLKSLGSDVDIVEDGSVLSIPIEGESRNATASLIDSRRVILPGQGTLSGVPLQRPEDRTMPIDRSIHSSVELEIAISTRLEELVRLDRRLAEENRRAALTLESDTERRADPARRMRLLVIGPKIVNETQCIESLRLRGYQVDTAQTEQEGLAVFDTKSPELVLADMHQGRNDGTSLVLALRQVTGIEEIPVILVDDARRQSSREAARRVGAAGYLVYPVDVQRISHRLESMVLEPQRRRFTRYRRKLPVMIEGATYSCMVTTLSRGGMFVATDDNLPAESLQRCKVSLPELDRNVSCEAEVVYRRGNLGRERGGVGVRFHSFLGSDENLLIDYLRNIEQATGVAT